MAKDKAEQDNEGMDKPKSVALSGANVDAKVYVEAGTSFQGYDLTSQVPEKWSWQLLQGQEHLLYCGMEHFLTT